MAACATGTGSCGKAGNAVLGWTGRADRLRRISAPFLQERFLWHAFHVFLLSAVVFFFVLSWMSWLQQELTPPVQADVNAAQAERPSTSSSAKEGGTALALDEYKQNIANNLFGSQDKEDEDSESEVSLKDIPLSEKDLGLELVGTITGGDSKQHIAIIEDTQKNEQNMYYEGDQVNNVTIKKILRDNVVIVQSDEQKILTMQYKKLRNNNVESNERRAYSKKGGQSFDKSKTISKDYVLQSLQDMSNLMQSALIKPYLQNGKTVGFQLDNIRSGSFYDRIGLKDKDVIMGVDGKELNNPQQLMSFSQNLKNKDQVRLTVQRDGQKRQIQYSLR
jgi:general secretion pathway protein C